MSPLLRLVGRTDATIRVETDGTLAPPMCEHPTRIEARNGHRSGGADVHVLFFHGGVVAPVHNGVEVQVDDRLLAGGEPAGDHPLIRGGQERTLVVVAGAIRVVGECGLLR